MDVMEKLVELAKPVLTSFPFPWCTVWRDVAEKIADAYIAHGVTVQEWISVDDRLPDDNDRVIAFRPNEPETSAYKYCVMWGWSVKASLKHRGITHWCEMTKPPKGE